MCQHNHFGPTDKSRNCTLGRAFNAIRLSDAELCEDLVNRFLDADELK